MASQSRSSSLVVDQLRTLLREGTLQAGSRLPSERDLSSQLGVSRLTVREALRTLEAHGIIEIRRGATGGAYVSVPTATNLGQTIDDLLTLQIVSQSEVAETRNIVEVGLVPLVCERASTSDIERLSVLCHEARSARESGNYDIEMSLKFHGEVTACTHNPVLVLLLQSLRTPFTHLLSEAQHSGTSGVDDHEEFVAAVARRDAVLAGQIMKNHLERTSNKVVMSTGE